MENNCIFCKIINKEIPAHIIYENEHVLVFLDASQSTKGHTLIIPKKHVKNIYEIDPVTLENVFSIIPKIANALKAAFDPIGLNILNNTDKPLQSVFHFHVHLIPRYEDDNFVVEGDNNFGKLSNDYLSELTTQIKDKL